MASRKRKAIDLDIKYQILLLNVEVMFYFSCWINKSRFCFSLWQLNNLVGHFNLFLNIACIMNGVTKKTQKTHKTKSAENILLQENHRSKNIIICQKITKQSRQNSYTSLEIIFFEIHHFSKGEVILHYFTYNKIRSRVPWTSL